MDGHLSRHLHKKNSNNAIIGNVGMLLSLCAVKSLNRIERIQHRKMLASFNGNSTTIIVTCNVVY